MYLLQIEIEIPNIIKTEDQIQEEIKQNTTQ